MCVKGERYVKPLNKELISQYDLQVKKYHYLRSSYFLETNKGKFTLRKVEIGEEQIQFCYEVDSYLERQNFDQLNHIYLTKKALPYAEFKDERYVMQFYKPAIETDFKHLPDLCGLISTLAQFHKAAHHISSALRQPEQVKIKNTYEYYTKRQNENNKLKKQMITLKQKSNFELMFLEECETYRELEELALSTIDYNLVNKLISQVIETKSVAHKALSYHTINKTPHNDYRIDHIDMCNYDIQVIDLSQILSKIMQKNAWDRELLYTLIETYNKERTLSHEEMILLKFMLIYPEKYNSICTQYMGSKHRWNYSMFEQKWTHMLSYKDHQIEAIKMLRSSC